MNGKIQVILVRWQGCYTLEFSSEVINLVCYRNKCLANLYNGLLDDDEENLKYIEQHLHDLVLHQATNCFKQVVHECFYCTHERSLSSFHHELEI
jgi:hypothetical protein